MLSRFVIFFALVAFAGSSSAQDSGDSEDNSTSSVSAARLEVKISQLEEHIRKLQGSIEQVTFENRQIKAQQDKVNADTQLRLSEMEKKLAAVPAASTVPSAPAGEPPKELGHDAMQPVEPLDPEDHKAGKGDKADATSAKFATPRDQYNYAFKLLNQAKYTEAGKEFSSFIADHAKDPLIGNAYYWRGETNYVRRDYVTAADDFRRGYESMPTGPKAPDNLLKLAMALNALNKDKEACVVLKEVIVKFGSSSSTVRPRAEQEINRIGCS